MPLHESILPARTRELFDAIRGLEALKSFTLVGGTALALHDGHRKSLDLDFSCYGGRLAVPEIESLLAAFRESGRSVELVTPQSQVVAARINGLRLLDFARDYMIDKVKVQFFAPRDASQAAYFDAFPRIDLGKGFSLMCRDGILAMKSAILEQRVRSRDLFDLMHMLKHDGYRIDDVFARAKEVSPDANLEAHKSALLGVTPLDEDDEGFEAVGVQTSIEEIYGFFAREVDDYEQRVAAALAASLR